MLTPFDVISILEDRKWPSSLHPHLTFKPFSKFCDATSLMHVVRAHIAHECDGLTDWHFCCALPTVQQRINQTVSGLLTVRMSVTKSPPSCGKRDQQSYPAGPGDS